MHIVQLAVIANMLVVVIVSSQDGILIADRNQLLDLHRSIPHFVKFVWVFDFCPFCHASSKIENCVFIGVYIENSNLTNIYLYCFSIYYP